MLIACRSCHRQYDVGDMKVGEHVRCRCGELLTVPEEHHREARALHCSGCGGKLSPGAPRCEYCGSEITLADRELGQACPECFARLAAGAGFCSDCGVKIAPRAVRAIPSTACCPRCLGSLFQEEEERIQYTECGSCGGIWLDSSTFENLVSTRDQASLSGLTRFASRVKEGAPPVACTVKYLPCPTCGTLMNRKNFGGCSGIIIDWCKGHGVWFDAEELEKVLQFVRSDGLDKARKMELGRQKEEIRRAEEHRKAMAKGTATPWHGGGWEHGGGGVTILDVAGSFLEILLGCFRPW